MILEAKDIEVSFKKENQKTLFGRERQQVIRGVTLQLKEGECLGIIGESGSGKSTLGKVLCGLLRPDKGSVILNGTKLYQPVNKEDKENLKNKLSIVFQDYTSSVNPRFRVSSIIGEALRSLPLKKEEKEQRIHELLLQVGLNKEYCRRYPHELSGGQLQRVCIARAMAFHPKVILLDEAISSLDAATQTQIMDLLIELREKFKFSYLFITHDLSAVTYLCDRVLFFHEGQVVEQVDSIELLSNIKSEYGKKLINSVIGLDYVPMADTL
jgi:nickel transport system ATP-binding protein